LIWRGEEGEKILREGDEEPFGAYSNTKERREKIY